MQHLLERFFDDPNAKHLSLVQRALQEQSQDDPSAHHPAHLQQLELLVENERWDDALTAADEMMPAYAISPRVHDLAARSASAIGDEDEAELESFMSAACRRALPPGAVRG